MTENRKENPALEAGLERSITLKNDSMDEAKSITNDSMDEAPNTSSDNPIPEIIVKDGKSYVRNTETGNLELLSDTEESPGDLKKRISESFSTPEGDRYELRNEGVYFVHTVIKTDKTGKAETSESEIKICNPLRVVAQWRTIDHEFFGKVLEWHDGEGKTRRQIIKNSQIQNNASDIRGTLADCGLGEIRLKGVNSKDYLQGYLHSVNPTKTIYLAKKLGWYKPREEKNYSFILPDKTIGEDSENVIFDNKQINMQWIGASGTLEEWQKQIAKPALASNRCIFAMSVVFASSLLDILEGYVDSRIFEFGGESSTGKTYALLFAQSVLGYREKLTNWRATQNGLERMALAHNDCTIFLDEIGIADKPQQILGDIYLLCSGASRTRSNTTLTTNKIETWKLLGLATGEINLRQYGDENKLFVKAGQEIRLANIPANAGKGYGVFESIPEGYKDMDDLSQRISSAFITQYGTAYQAWIERLVNLRNFSNVPNSTGEGNASSLKDQIIQGIDDFVREAFSGQNYSDQILRVAKTFGLVAVAGDMASGNGLLDNFDESNFNITGWSCNDSSGRGDAWRASLECFKAWIVEFGASFISREDQDLIDNAKDIFSSQAGRFIGEGEKYPPKDQIGWTRVYLGEFQFLVRPKPYKKYFCRGKAVAHVDEVLKEAKIYTGKKDENFHPESRGGTTTSVRIFVDTDNDKEGNESLES